MDAQTLAEMAFAVLGFVILSGAATRLIEPTPPMGMRLEEAPRANLAAILVFVASTGLLAVRFKSYLHHLLPNIVILLPVLFALTSTFWSIDPEVSRNRAIALIGSTIFGAYVGVRFNLREIAMILFAALGFIALGSFMAAVLSPRFGVMQLNEGMDHHAGNWRGLLGHRVKLAQVACLMVIVTVALWRTIPLPGLIKVGAVMVAAICIAGSRSAQGIIAAFALSVFIVFYRSFFALPLTARIAAFLGVAAVALPLVFFAEEITTFIFMLVGRSPDMSARVYIWESAWLGGLQRPLLGGGFHMGWPSGASFIHGMRFINDPGHAHNGFLTLWLDLGVVGLIMILPPFVTFLIRASAVKQFSFHAYILSISFAILYVMLNYVDSVLMQGRDPVWVFLVVLLFMNTRLINNARQATRMTRPSTLAGSTWSRRAYS